MALKLRESPCVNRAWTEVRSDVQSFLNRDSDYAHDKTCLVNLLDCPTAQRHAAGSKLTMKHYTWKLAMFLLIGASVCVIHRMSTAAQQTMAHQKLHSVFQRIKPRSH